MDLNLLHADTGAYALRVAYPSAYMMGLLSSYGWKKLRHVAGWKEVTYRYWQPGTNTNTNTNILGFPSTSNNATTTSHHALLSTTNSVKMPSYIVTLKDDASDAQIAAAKKKATDAGGQITHEYTLIKGFAVSYPEGTVSTLEDDPTVQAVEPDTEMKTQ